MRGSLPGCSLVSFGDLGTGLALRTSASRHYKQDYLEGLMQQAAQSFAASDVIAPSGSAMAPASVIVATPEEFRFFLRSADCATDVLFCVCSDLTGRDVFEEAATQVFRSVSGAVSGSGAERR
jgi:hypothetical protein